MTKTLARLLALAACSALPAFAAAPPAVPPAFAALVPAALPNGLQLVEVKNRCDACAPWRQVDFLSNDSPLPVRQEKVSVQAGVTAMYAFPGTQYFANTKVEQSVAGHYEQDQAIVKEAVAHECARKKARIAEYLGDHPEVKEKLDRVVAKGKDYVEFEQGSYQGIAYVSCTHNAISLMGPTLSQLQIFLPQRDTIITAYLLEQKQTRFRTIEEFLQLRREFIEQTIAFLQAK